MTEYRLYVPRVLFVDEGRNMVRRRSSALLPDDVVNDCWKGGTERLDLKQQQESDAALPVNDAFDDFLNSATVMATNAHSRYRSQSTFQSKSRQVNWDEENDMMDEDDQEISNRQQQLFKSQTQPLLQSQLEEYWRTSTQKEAASSTSWFDYLAPPHHPKSLLSLPTTSFDQDYDYYSYTHTMPAWLENDCLERLRWLLEECDSCGGVVVAGSRSWADGLATKLLQELEQEVPSASRWMISMSEQQKQDDSSMGPLEAEHVDIPTWRTQQVQNVRRRLQTGLALAEQSQHAHAILPLSNTCSIMQAAAALEAATLCYRLHPSAAQSARIALNSYYGGSYGGEFPFGTVPYLSFAEFLTTMKPSNTHLMLELDSLLPTTDFSINKLQQGTSVERDLRMKHQQETSCKRAREELPGLWMKDTTENGILSACSPLPTDRSNHTHFCLAAAMRPASLGTTISEQTLCLMEGMGVRYQPEQSLATVLPQSMAQLTQGGYAAGSYWKSMYQLKAHTTTLSVLGNSTRSFGFLQKTCSDMKSVFGPSMKGFYNRDVKTGILPELEDVEHSLSLIYNLRDTYRPPEGSGLADERELHFEE
ncbi:hypothetical protein MPSEU_000075700 [Mayamaea pseudoterrestris]|nr:hypothetical protein MPSEU_000075700 [Mayamaea pseudoterrestris]